MTTKGPIRTSCLCKAVSLKVSILPTEVDACHCSMCRKWGGGPFFALLAGNEVEFEGEEHISCFNSSEWAERGFCSKCGTHLFYRLKEHGIHILSAGLFQEVDNFQFLKQVFIDEKPTYYSFSNQTKNLTGEEVFAEFASEEN